MICFPLNFLTEVLKHRRSSRNSTSIPICIGNRRKKQPFSSKKRRKKQRKRQRAFMLGFSYTSIENRVPQHELYHIYMKLVTLVHRGDGDSTWSRYLSPTMTNMERCLVLTPFSIKVLIRSSTFFLIFPPLRNASARTTSQDQLGAKMLVTAPSPLRV